VHSRFDNMLKQVVTYVIKEPILKLRSEDKNRNTYRNPASLFPSAGKIPKAIRTGLLGDSVFLIGSNAVSALGGFLFWLLAARLTTTASVGIASALIASSMLLVSISDMGLSVSIVRFHSLTSGNERLINTAIRLALVFATGSVILFLFGLPWWSPALIIVREAWPLATLFLLFTVGNQIMAYQDMAMLSIGNLRFIFWRNVACNIPTSLILFMLLPIVAVETVVAVAFMLPNVMTVFYTSLVTLPKNIPGYRMLGGFELQVFQTVKNYGFNNHLGNLLWALPAYLLPILAASGDSLDAAGVFAISWTLTNAIYIIPRTVSLAFFARLSRPESRFIDSLLRSAAIIFGFGIPSAALLWVVSPWLLSLFGRSYVDTKLLGTMLLSFVPFSINSLLFSILRVGRNPKWIIVFSASYCFTVIASIQISGSQGIQGIANGWLVGSTLAILPGLITSAYSLRNTHEDSKSV